MKKLLAAILAIFFVAFVPLAEAQGVPLWLRKVSSAPPPPPPYDPLGVRFWPETAAQYIGIANLNGGVDTGHGIVAYRARNSRGAFDLQSTPDAWQASNNFGSVGNLSCTSENSTGGMLNQDGSPWSGAGVGYTLKSTFNQADSACPSGTARGIDVGSSNTVFDNTWASYVQFYDAPSGKITIFKDGVLLCTQATCATINSSPTLVNWNTSRGFCFSGCNRGSGLPAGGVADLSDVIIDTANPLPAGCPATPANCNAVVAAYISPAGVPVNPGTTTTDCATFRASYSATVQTDYCDRGDATTFLLNGDGTAHAAIATNLNGGSNIPATLYSVDYGQGVTPSDRPYLVWSAYSQCGFTTTSTTCSLSPGGNVTGNFGGEIKTNDRLFAAFGICEVSAAPSVNLPGSGTPAGNDVPAGWTFIGSTASTNPAVDTGTGSTTRCQWGVYTHVATADYVANNTLWATGNAFMDPPTFHYDCIPTGACATAPKGVIVLLFNYRSANGVVNIVSSNFQSINRTGCTGSCTGIYVSAPLTTSTTPETLVSLIGFRQGNAPVMVPTGTALQHTYKRSSSNAPFYAMSDERISASLSSATRTFTQPTAGSVAPTANDRAYAGLIALADH